MEQRWADILIRNRYLCAVASVLLTLALCVGLGRLYFDSDYLSFFDKADPQRVAQELVEATYTDNTVTLFLIHHPEGLFQTSVLEDLRWLTDRLWRAPYAERVDSLANFQHSYSEEDELIVESLVPDVGPVTASDIERTRAVALTDVQLVGRMVSRDGRTTVVSVNHDFGDIDESADFETLKAQRLARDTAQAEAVAYAQTQVEALKQRDPAYEVHLTGPPIINHSFNNSAMRDSATLNPLMFVMVAVMLGLFLGSLGSVIGALIVIVLSAAGAMGWSSWMGMPVGMLSVTAPVIILTIAVCDSVHLQVVYLRLLGTGLDREAAMRGSLEINIQPIVLTSMTTVIGFLTLNFSDSPNFQALGNISAVGVALAMLLTLLFLPAWQMLFARKGGRSASTLPTEWFANVVIRHSRRLFAGTLLLTMFLLALIPLNTMDDDPIKMFEPGIPYRDAADFSQQHLPAIKNLDFSFSCGSPGCIHDPAYLRKLEQFSDWLAQREGAEYVRSYLDIIKRLNQNMHGDDPAYYRLPDSREMAAQYHLLYELSLPEGLDMNNTISFDQSSTLVSLWLRQINTNRLVDMEQDAQRWFAEHYPGHPARGASIDMMFAALGQRTVIGMAVGAVIALIGVTLSILIALRSFKYGLMSMVPNAFPAAISLGIWGAVVGEVNMAVSTVFSVTLGLVVDNTVHFISKYRRAREGLGQTTDEAIRYAFSTVGPALVVTTAVLVTGFSLLTLSDFNVNAYMGGLTAITILVALVFDVIMLPALLKMVDGPGKSPA